MTDLSTSVSEVSMRTPYSRWPSARATVSAVPTQSFSNVRLITLVDFENDCVGTALTVARALGQRLYGVRIDTSETLVDKSVIPQMGTFKPTGVNPQLVWNVRRALDREGVHGEKIVVCGGFTVAEIRHLQEQGGPGDMYGVGPRLFQGRLDFTPGG